MYAEWAEYSRELMAEGVGPTEIQRDIAQKVEQQNRPPSEAPTLRTVQRWQTAFNRLSLEQKAAYHLFHWPQSMGGPDLPWKASRAVLDLMAELHQRGVPRLLNRNVKWFWRVTLAAPDLGIGHRWRIANRLALLELRGKVSERERTQALEWSLAYAPWRGDKSYWTYVEAILMSRIDALALAKRTGQAADMIEFFNFEDSGEEDADMDLRELETYLGAQLPDTAEGLRAFAQNLKIRREEREKEETDGKAKR